MPGLNDNFDLYDEEQRLRWQRHMSELHATAQRQRKEAAERSRDEAVEKSKQAGDFLRFGLIEHDAATPLEYGRFLRMKGS